MHQPAGKLFDAADDDATAQASAAAMPAVDAHSGRHLLAVFSEQFQIVQYTCLMQVGPWVQQMRSTSRHQN